jgi:hypothetical protein
MTTGVTCDDFSEHVTLKRDVIISITRVLGDCDIINEEGTWTREIVC